MTPEHQFSIIIVEATLSSASSQKWNVSVCVCVCVCVLCVSEYVCVCAQYCDVCMVRVCVVGGAYGTDAVGRDKWGQILVLLPGILGVAPPPPVLCNPTN